MKSYSRYQKYQKQYAKKKYAKAASRLRVQRWRFANGSSMSTVRTKWVNTSVLPVSFGQNDTESYVSFVSPMIENTQKTTVMGEAFPVSAWDTLTESDSQLSHWMMMYNQLRIDGVKVEIVLPSGATESQPITLAYNWDRAFGYRDLPVDALPKVSDCIAENGDNRVVLRNGLRNYFKTSLYGRTTAEKSGWFNTDYSNTNTLWFGRNPFIIRALDDNSLTFGVKPQAFFPLLKLGFIRYTKGTSQSFSAMIKLTTYLSLRDSQMNVGFVSSKKAGSDSVVVDDTTERDEVLSALEREERESYAEDKLKQSMLNK